MFSRIIFSILIVVYSCSNSSAQNTEIKDILRVVEQKMNTALLVTDSLQPFYPKGLGKKLGLSKKEIKEIKKKAKLQHGLKLDKSYTESLNFIAAEPLYTAFNKLDSESLQLIEKKKPFYLLSVPIFFRDANKAIIDVTLIGGYGTTYILEKKESHWVIIKEIIRWAV